jgi:hypothetical protein
MLWCIGILLLSVSAYAEAPYLETINSGGAAVEKANRVSGISQFFTEHRIAIPAARVKTEGYYDTTTPFLHESLNGRSAWRVTYSDFNLILDNLFSSVRRRSGIKTCDIWRDSLTGQLLMVDIRSVGGQGDAPLYPTLEGWKGFVKTTGERYLGLPDTNAGFGMLNALTKCGGHPKHTMRTVLYYLRMTKPFVADRPGPGETVEFEQSAPYNAWIILLPSIDAVPSMHAGQPNSGHFSFMTVNATTGDGSGLGTMTYPVEPEEKPGSSGGGKAVKN